MNELQADNIIARLEDEVERLRTANEYAIGELTARRADTEQLRALLREAVEDPRRNVLGDDWWKRARRALEQKP